MKPLVSLAEGEGEEEGYGDLAFGIFYFPSVLAWYEIVHMDYKCKFAVRKLTRLLFYVLLDFFSILVHFASPMIKHHLISLLGKSTICCERFVR